jgi:zinc protease
MIRISRLTLLASCAVALVACGSVKSFMPRFGAKHPPAAAARTAKSKQHDRRTVVVAPAAAPTAAPPANVWPQSYADLPPDPAMRFGTLSNGMRYVVMKNTTPGGQASLRLQINAGSMQESDAQQGLAHFLEHMAFDGSRHVPEGEMVKILQRHGLAFGADTNASTSWEDTTFKLDLPKADEDTVDTSLMLLREVASELTLSQDAIDHERGVVLSEERLRDTPGYEVLKQNLGFSLRGLRAADRLPIGQVEVIQHASHELIADYYGKYYRPSRALLVAVGDFDPDAMEAKIKARFGDWAASAPAGADPDFGAPVQRGTETRVVVQPGGPQIVQFDWIAPPDRAPDSRLKRRRATVEALGLGILNRRLDRLVRAGDPPFIGAGAYRQEEFHSARVTTIQADPRPGEWRGALETADQAVRQLIQYGVSADELSQQIDADRASMKAAAEGAATRPTPSIAEDILGALDVPEVETSPAEDLAGFEAAVKGLTPAEVNAALKEAFSGSGPLVLVATPDPIDGGEAAVTTALAAAQASPLSPPSAEAALTWPYEVLGPLGQVAERRDIVDLDTVFVRFENGVRLTVRPTKFAENQILVQARVGRGQLGLPSDRASPAWAAAAAFPESGLDQLSAQDLDLVLRSRILGKSFSVGEDAFVLSGTTRPEDLDTQLQLLAAYLAHPGWRPEAFQRMRSAGPTILEQLEATPEGVLNRDLGRLLHAGDRRWGFPSRAEIAGESPADLNATLAPDLTKGSIEVVMVGDITVEKAIDAVAATFGALPARPADAAPSAASGPVAFPVATPSPVVLTHSGRADQAIGLIAWPTEDFLSDTQRSRTLGLLAQVMQLRVTDRLRMDQGVTYSPSVQASPSQAFAHYGYLSTRVEIPPAKLDGFFADVAAITSDLRSREITPDELERAKKPAVDDLERRRQTNEYWLNALAGAQADPRRLAAIRSSIGQLQHISAEDLRRAAGVYLVDDKAWKLEVKPKGAP